MLLSDEIKYPIIDGMKDKAMSTYDKKTNRYCSTGFQDTKFLYRLRYNEGVLTLGHFAS